MIGARSLPGSPGTEHGPSSDLGANGTNTHEHMKTPAYRYLRGSTLDPGSSTRLSTVGINEALYRVRYEAVQPGPVGEYVEVVDFDPASGCWYDPIDLSAEHVATQQGLRPSEGDPQFHQQMCYAVAMKTIEHFERALGRRVIWRERKVTTARKALGMDSRKRATT